MDESLQHLYLSGDKSRHISCLVRDKSGLIRPELLMGAFGKNQNETINNIKQTQNQNKAESFMLRRAVCRRILMSWLPSTERSGHRQTAE